ncbi:MAG TPA: carboxypeptidase-like regulatory domain-containing protein [Chthoniobacterales bacterium]
MKNFRRSLLFTLLASFSAASLVSASSLPAMQITISNSAGKLVYKGRTNSQGLFTTPSLMPGKYVVQFNATKSLKGRELALVLGTGKKKVVANSVAGSKFNQGGVAMKVEVDKAMTLTGQVADAATAATNATASNGRVKYINGKKYVWEEGEMGSNLGGRWVDANSPEAQNVTLIDRKGIQEFQDRTQPPPPPNAK